MEIPASGNTRCRIDARQISTTSSLSRFARRASLTNLSIAQKQIAPTTQIIKTPIKTESMATPCAGTANARASCRIAGNPTAPRRIVRICSYPRSGTHAIRLSHEDCFRHAFAPSRPRLPHLSNANVAPLTRSPDFGDTMTTDKRYAATILSALGDAQSELVGKAVILTDGKAGTVENVWLDELHGLQISIGGHDGKWPISTIKLEQSCQGADGPVPDHGAFASSKRKQGTSARSGIDTNMKVEPMVRGRERYGRASERPPIGARPFLRR